MSKNTLYHAKPEDVVRLAKWLKLSIDGMDHRQICKLVYWRVTRGISYLSGTGYYG